MDWLAHVFGQVCGQMPEHTWQPGGLPLPVCQRCTGLYAGAAAAALLLACLRPRLEGRFLQIHGAFLLVMAPFGFHWMPQGAAGRAVTGVLFGAAVVVFLALWPAESLVSTRLNSGNGSELRRAEPGQARRWSRGGYFAGLAAAALGVPALGQWGGPAAAGALGILIAAGGLVIAGLATANLAWLAMTAWRWLARSRRAARA